MGTLYLQNNVYILFRRRNCGELFDVFWVHGELPVYAVSVRGYTSCLNLCLLPEHLNFLPLGCLL